MTLLTADDAPTVRFEVSLFKEGYRQDKVGVFLDDVATTIRELEERPDTSQEPSGPSLRKAEILLTAGDIRDIRFPVIRWPGYHVDQIDTFIVQVLAAMEALEAQVCISSFVDQPSAGTDAAYGGVYGSEAYGMSPAQTGYIPGDTDGAGDAQYAEAIAQRDQYIAQPQRENAYLRAELESVQHRLGMIGYQSSPALRSPGPQSRWDIIVNGQDLQVSVSGRLSVDR